MIDSFSEIQLMEREGNYNRVILAVAENYRDLRMIRLELLKRIGHYLGRFRPLISPQSIEAIRSLPESDLHCAGLTGLLNAASDETAGQSIGSIMFPVVTSAGIVREILVTEGDGRNLSPTRLQVLDRAGSATFRILGKKLGRQCFWRPERYAFSVLDPYGSDDPSVEGDSMLLPLALALYSHVTAKPVPADLSASAALGRDGSLQTVAGIGEKLATLRRERFYIKRVLVSDRQENCDAASGIEVIKVRSLDQALSLAFPDPPAAGCFSGEMDLGAEIDSLNGQYESYLIDTCIENADELIHFITSGPSAVPEDRAIPALFTCYWKKGSCHCHKGEVKETDRSLKKAISLYRRHPGLIRADDYFDARISYGVLLKDLFRYGEAEAIHVGLMEEMRQTRCLDHTRGKNLSTLSQLCLAEGYFEKAEKYQRLALPLIRREERCRNYGYLAQIHARSGDFRKAAKDLQQYSRLLESACARDRGAHTPFYHWMKGEYLFRRGAARPKKRSQVFRELNCIVEMYPDPGWWVPALIRKFSGLALLVQGKETEGLEELDGVVRYFSSQFAPVLRVLGASVRAERAGYFFRTGRHERAWKDIGGIVEDLSLQKDIKRFFRPDLSALSRFLRSAHHGTKTIGKIFAALENIIARIPY